MIETLQAEIERKAKRILEKQRYSAALSRKYSAKFTKRTGVQSSASIKDRPDYWDLHPHFDPVYCIKHSKYLSRIIWSRIQANNYQPIPAIQFQIDKPDGGFREIMQFGIPDSAIANLFHRRITKRNSGLFSAYSFAYRADKTIFEAIIHLKRLMSHPKTYILKYDYRKYFDTIEHDYLKRLLSQRQFVISSAERNVISAFLTHEYTIYPSWQTRKYTRRQIGVPQGSSLSLFLSNIAAHELDMELERLNGSFVRFADDVIALAHSYTDARRIELSFREHCDKTGVSINFDKSPGIQLLNGRSSQDTRTFFLDEDDGSSLNHVKFVDFLGHRVSPEQIDLPAKAVARIKKRISRIINIHLILYARRRNKSPINPDRLGAGHLDWDLVTCLNEIRRYIYGGLAEAEIRAFIDDDKKLRIVRGLLAFYPLVTTSDSLKQLDGWLKNVVQRAIVERNKLIKNEGLPANLQYKISEPFLISGDWYNSSVPNETRLPSFVLGWRAARKYYARYGLSGIEGPSYYSAMSLYS